MDSVAWSESGMGIWDTRMRKCIVEMDSLKVLK